MAVDSDFDPQWPGVSRSVVKLLLSLTPYCLRWTKATEYNPHLLPPWWQRHAIHHNASALHKRPSFPINMKSWSMPSTITLLLCKTPIVSYHCEDFFCVNTSASVSVSPPPSSRFSHSLRNTGCFHWRTVLEINIYTLHMLKAAVEPSPMTGEEIYMCILTWMHICISECSRLHLRKTCVSVVPRPLTRQHADPFSSSPSYL